MNQIQGLQNAAEDMCEAYEEWYSIEQKGHAETNRAAFALGKVLNKI